LIDSWLGHYRILWLLGSGMGEVYRAHDTELGRDVALKVVRGDRIDDPHERTRLLREAKTAAQLKHPHICTIHQVGEIGDVLYIDMELVEGSTLRARIPDGGLPWTEVARYGGQIADALAHAHAHGVIHRDLKSINVMLDEGDRVKVVDFGIARIVPGSGLAATEATTTQPEGMMISGTPATMAPEAVRGEKGDARSDVWSLGVVLYEMACGSLPFRGATVIETFAAILNEPPAPLPPDVDARLAATIGRCLQKDSAKRPADAAAVRDELERMRNGPAAAPRAKPRLLPWVAAALVVVAGTAFLLARMFPPTAALAVLPLENLSADRSQTYFADGVTEELIGDLGQVAQLRVLSRNSVMRYRGSNRPLPAIGRELGVGFLVTGSVRTGEDSVRINAQLTRLSPRERVVWSSGYTRSAREVLALQGEVAREIAQRVAGRISPAERSRLARAPVVQPEAYEEYLRGRAAWNLRTNAGMAEAITRFEHAIALDPKLALAYAGLADAYARSSLYTGRPPRETYPLARTAANAALALDEGMAEAHTSLAGVALFYDHDWERARSEFVRAIALRPSYPTAHHWYSIWLRDRGRFPEAIQEAERAVAVDPKSPILQVNLADTHYYARAFAAAIALHRKVLAADSSFAPAWLYLGTALAQSGHPAEAVDAVERAWRLGGGKAYALGPLGYVRARAGDLAGAQRVRADLVALSGQGSAVAFDLALVEVGLGHRAEALRRLAQAEEERGPLHELAVDPRFDPLRSDPAFRQLLGRLGLAENQKRA
jgi:non-specific serine/threonine protein kinase